MELCHMSLEITATAELLRASHISRWGIVQTAVRQNIAEHMYRVWVLVRAWGRLVDLDDVQQALAEQLALMHDLPEIRTGDAPTPHKTPEMKAHLAEIERLIYPYLRVLEDTVDPQVAALVKHCDTAEAIFFLQVNGLGKHASDVKNLLLQQMLDRLATSPFTPKQQSQLVEAFHTTLHST
jgi:5'-deoxynucleotidase YfbR-like HD superfamily hydrolase